MDAKPETSNQKLKVLLIEDNPGDARLIKEMLAEAKLAKFDLHVSMSLLTGFDRLEKGGIDVLLLDLGLPDSQGLETLKKVRAQKFDVPVLVLTGLADETIGRQAVHEGAQDYLIKGQVDSSLLIRAIHYAIERKQIEKELNKSYSELSVLYRVSSAISRTIDMSELFSDIMDTITSLDILDIKRKGAIFIADGDRLNLAFDIGHSEDFLKSDKSIGLGECLCGMAAANGEIIISNNSHKDNRHTIQYPGMTPHGHVIIPLKIKERVTGVLCLYMKADTDMDHGKVKMLLSLGNQIAVAIENARLYEETKALSLHDGLTGLANRRYMEIIFEKAFAGAKRGPPLSVIMFDIDHFKKYNDTYGHVAGDAKLIAVAQAAAKVTREMNVIARYGGEEFLMMLFETGLTEASGVAERLRKIIEAETGITVSLGVASYDQRIKTKEDLIKKADEALYQAKNKGRNRVECSGEK